jgi:hypothetical protein
LSPDVALAGETVSSAATPDDTLVFGLTAMQFVTAASVGAGAAAAAAIASGNAIVGASLGLGTLGTIYVAHWFVEAAVLGGTYYWWPDDWWPWAEEPKTSPSPTPGIQGRG